jgi:hypothetical protein
MTHIGPICPHRKKMVPNIVGVRLVGGKIIFIPVVNSNGMTYVIMVNIYAENDRYIQHTSSLIPQWRPCI